MRLSDAEILGIIEAVEKYMPEKKGELRLYGSRVDDNKKGGDIDLLLLMPNEHLKQMLVEHKHIILRKIKDKIGERKIDLLICQQDDIEQDPFVGLIYPASIILKAW